MLLAHPVMNEEGNSFTSPTSDDVYTVLVETRRRSKKWENTNSHSQFSYFINEE